MLSVPVSYFFNGLKGALRSKGRPVSGGKAAAGDGEPKRKTLELVRAYHKIRIFTACSRGGANTGAPIRP